MLTTRDLLLKLRERHDALALEVVERRGISNWEDYIRKTAAIKELKEVELIAAESEKKSEEKRA